MELKDVLELLKNYPNVAEVELHPDDGLRVTMFEPPKHEDKLSAAPEQTASTVELKEIMPPDDVMLFAATEDIDELMKQRIAKPPAEV